MAFIQAEGIHKVIARFEESDGDVQWKTLDCIKTLFAHGLTFFGCYWLIFSPCTDDIRTTFIRADGILEFFERFNNSNPHVQWMALSCLATLLPHSMTF